MDEKKKTNGNQYPICVLVSFEIVRVLITLKDIWNFKLTYIELDYCKTSFPLKSKLKRIVWFVD